MAQQAWRFDLALEEIEDAKEYILADEIEMNGKIIATFISTAKSVIRIDSEGYFHTAKDNAKQTKLRLMRDGGLMFKRSLRLVVESWALKPDIEVNDLQRRLMSLYGSVRPKIKAS